MVTLEVGPTLSDRDMARIARLVYDASGITLHDGKKSLVVARLQKRLRALGLTSYSDYLKYLERDATGAELEALLDAIATNHTLFFREEQHFRILEDVARRRAGSAPLAVWSAACSSGEEPYTIAMTLERMAPPCPFTLLASDISTKALTAAKRGVYKMSAVEAIPQDVLRQFFEKGLGAQSGFARIAPALQRLVEFRHLNLLEVGDLQSRFEVIFCRNVMIYFDLAVQQRVVDMLVRHLRPGGYLFISHSESLNGVTHPLKWV